MPSPSAPPVIPAFSNLTQPRNTNFVGRADTLLELERHFTDPIAPRPVQAIAGMPGAGKSSVALEYAYSRANLYDIVWWIRAETPATIAADLAHLAVRILPAGQQPSDVHAAVRALRRILQTQHRWLLIFDDAQWPHDVAPCLPWGSKGHVLITSRNAAWKPMASVMPLAELDRAEAVQYLQQRVKTLRSAADADRLATALGDLPLALAQAASYIQQTRISPTDYLTRFETEWAHLLHRGKPSPDYPASAAMAWELSFKQLESVDLAAADLLTVASFLATERIPTQMFLHGAAELPAPLNESASSPQRLTQTLATLSQFSLADASDDSFSVHRLVAMLARDRLSDEARAQWAQIALDMAAAGFVFDSHDASTWSTSLDALPHVLQTTEHAREAKISPGKVANLLDDAGRLLLKQHQFEQARTVLETAYALVKSTQGPRSPKAAGIANNLGRVRHRLGQYADAMNLYESAMEIDAQLYGPATPQMASVANNFGMTLLEMGKPREARERFEWALNIYETHYGQQHIKVATVANNLGFVLMRLKEIPEAGKCFERALGITETLHGSSHPNLACIEINLGHSLLVQTRKAEAYAHFERALQLDQAIFGPNHPRLAADLARLAQIFIEAHEYTTAIEYLQSAVQMDETTFGPDSPRLVPHLKELARALKAANQSDRAAEVQHRATALAKKPKESHHTLHGATLEDEAILQ